MREALSYIVPAVVALVLAGGGWMLVRRAAVGPTLVVFEKTIEGYKEMAAIEEQHKATLRADKAALQEQLKVKDALYVALEATLKDERARAGHLERMVADWVLERATLITRIGLLEAQVLTLQQVEVQKHPPSSPTLP